MTQQNPQDQQLNTLYQARKQQHKLPEQDSLRKQLQQAHPLKPTNKLALSNFRPWGGALAACLVIAIVLNFLPSLEQHPELQPSPEAALEIQFHDFAAQQELRSNRGQQPEQLQTQEISVKKPITYQAKKSKKAVPEFTYRIAQIKKVSTTTRTMLVKFCDQQQQELTLDWALQAKPQQWIKIYYRQDNRQIDKIASLPAALSHCPN